MIPEICHTRPPPRVVRGGPLLPTVVRETVGAEIWNPWSLTLPTASWEVILYGGTGEKYPTNPEVVIHFIQSICQSTTVIHFVQSIYQSALFVPIIWNLTGLASSGSLFQPLSRPTKGLGRMWVRQHYPSRLVPTRDNKMTETNVRKVSPFNTYIKSIYHINGDVYTNFIWRVKEENKISCTWTKLLMNFWRIRKSSVKY